MISIIIPLYNKESIIEKSLMSVLSQDYNDFEVIVVNDGSTDSSAKIVQNIKDTRVQLICQENGGPSKARNTGIRAAKGEWLYLIDADDVMEPGTLSIFHEYAQKHPEMDMFLGEIFINNNKERKIAKTYKDGPVKNVFKSHFYGKLHQCSGSTLYKKECCEQSLYDETIRRFEDLECLFRKYRKNKIYLIHRPVATINVEYASASRSRTDIREDFLGHLTMQGKSFWEKMSLYKFYLEERPRYNEQCKKTHPTLYKRYDLFFIYKFLLLFKKNK